ncbi:GvpL/GvpF family gas vesicle protein [Streptomyces sp. PSKA54]|uniref:GvpL/GvpF family gas vesicle protein n=1 Tax=Streptomyces himalayensis subsp. aureolus TaxID=2758039 RepID=A0A7W2HFI1_9ACTN|nr:GvpL/GvpF family gas vesicle protein [Streptomyces himalayensis]MBA4861915.1 GvpL/GvpF family gas vesicle protein [Streptomyces himalayensis subsp. aureolus]
MSGLRYVYAVCRPFEAPLQAELTGVAGNPPKLLRHGDLVAVVSAVPEGDFAEEPLRRHLEDLDWLSDTARAHEKVIAALTTVTSPLPLRLATVFRDDSGVRTMMEDEGERLHTALERIAGRVEWGVKVYVDPEKSAPQSPAAEPKAKPATGRDYLRRKRAEHERQETTWERAENFARRLHEHLSRHAQATRLHPPQNPVLSRAPGRNVLNAAYLVDRSHSEEFVELVDRTKDEEPGLRVELTGPWAAYSFSSLDDYGQGAAEGEYDQGARGAYEGEGEDRR